MYLLFVDFIYCGHDANVKKYMSMHWEERVELMCVLCGQDNNVLNMYMGNIYAKNFHVYNCLFWLGSRSLCDSQYSKASIDVLSISPNVLIL